MMEEATKNVKLRLSDWYPNTFPEIIDQLTENDIHDIATFFDDDEKFKTQLKYTLKKRDKEYLLTLLTLSNVEHEYGIELRAKIKQIYSGDEASEHTVINFLNTPCENEKSCNCKIWQTMSRLDVHRLKYFTDKIVRHTQESGQNSKKLGALQQVLLYEMSEISESGSPSTMSISKNVLMSSVLSSLVLQKYLASNPDVDYRIVLTSIMRECVTVFASTMVKHGSEWSNGSITWQRFEKKAIDNGITFAAGIAGSLIGSLLWYKYRNQIIATFGCAISGILLGQSTIIMLDSQILRFFGLPSNKSTDKAFRLLNS